MLKQVPNKRKRIVLTLKQKMEICKRLEKGESRAALMEEFNVGSSTIYDIKAQSHKIKEFYVKSDSERSVEKRHTLHTPKMKVLDQALYEWFLLKRSEGGYISGPMLQEKAREFHEKMNIEGQCSFSSGWLTRFKVRHGIRKLDFAGEHKSANFETATASFCDVFSELVADNGLTSSRTHDKMNVAVKEESDADDGCEAETVSWQRATEAFETVIAFAEQQPFFTSQQIMQLHILQNLTLHERHRVSEQGDSHPFISTSSTDEDSKLFISTSRDPVPATLSYHDATMSTQ
uniref:HTH CENPB-type domain-containing protein n=1 Tax=Arion vulgaris TaxID=1028688 RepID=A0A0B7B047_9EUPU